jgi:flagellar biosynthesis anti-sigma factor FlgM
MAVKNVSQSNITPSSLGKVKNTDSSKPAVTTDLSNLSNANAATPIDGTQNKNYGVELSEKGLARAAEQKKAFEIAKNTPDIREDKVAAIKAKIQDGKYPIDSGKIADGMLREAIMEHLATSKDS